MRITAFLMLICCMHVSASSFSQTVTMNSKDASLKKIFTAIKEQTGYVVFYNQQLLENTRAVTVNVSGMQLKDFMTLILRDQPLNFRIDDKTIVLSEKPRTVLFYDRYPVKGYVTDAEGRPLPGASVRIKGSREGVMTDGNGRFSLNINDGDIIVVSFVGYTEMSLVIKEGKPVDIPAKGSVTAGSDGITIQLAQEEGALEEVTVNAGYYRVKDRERTGNISKVSSRDIERQPVTNPLMALQGRVPGLMVMPNSGMPGASLTVEIRGRNTLRWDGRYPLYIVDGIPVDAKPFESNVNNQILVGVGFDPLSTINPANIESIEVLKDADATAIYGSRGANGVILITTKTGSQTGKTDIDLSAYTGSGKMPRYMDLLDRRQYLDLRKEAFANAGETPDAGNAPDLVLWDTTRSTDWQRELLGGSAPVRDVQLNISGGGQHTSFRFGGGYHREGMIFADNLGVERANATFSLRHMSDNRRFSAGVSVNMGIETNKSFLDGDIVSKAIQLPPNAPKLYNEDGSLNWENSTWINPLSALGNSDEGKMKTWNISTSLSYKISRSFELNVTMGYNTSDRKSIGKHPLSAMPPAYLYPGITPYSEFGTHARTSLSAEPQLVYDRTYGEHHLKVILGASVQQSTSAYQFINAMGYSSDIQLGTLKGATSTVYAIDDNSEYKYLGGFARVGYDYAGRYFLNITGRRDGSSRFGSNNRYANFASVGAAWIFSDEPAIAESLPFLSFGKLRGSYGTTGNDQIGDYKFLSTYAYTYVPYYGTASLIPSGLANPEYAWEVTRKLEFGLELGLLKDRFTVSASWYRNLSSNQLLDYPLPGATGFSGVISNLNAKIENKGWEVLLRSMNMERGAFKWTSSLNFTVPRNRLVSYPDLENSPNATNYIIGKSIYGFRLFQVTGVNPQTGFYEAVDFNKDGQITFADQQVMLEVSDKIYGGLSNTFTYKGIELSFLIHFSNKMLETYPPTTMFFMNNQTVAILGRWRKPGDQTRYQKLSTSYSQAGEQDYWYNMSQNKYEHAMFARLRNLTLSYNLPAVLLRRIALKNCMIYLQGQNLLMATRTTEFDPDTGDELPPLRMITAGLQIKI